MERIENTDKTPSLCRDCGERFPNIQVEHCPNCLGPRLLSHLELLSLSMAHLDCDAFYASVEKRDDPSLMDKPVIIGGGKRGVVSTCCYIARMHGIHSAMPMFRALQSCPDAVVIHPNMQKYKAVGHQVRSLMADLTPLVEPISIDEAYLDLAHLIRDKTNIPAVALIHLQKRLENELGITASIGLAPNKFLAKLASDLDKPKGFSLIGQREAKEFLAPLPVNKLWGVGPALSRRLSQVGINKIGELQKYTTEDLTNRFGSIGHQLAEFSLGKDERSIKTKTMPKSISAEITFAQNYSNLTEIKPVLEKLCERVSQRLKISNVAGNAVVLKLKTSNFTLLTRTSSLVYPTQRANLLYETGTHLLEKELGGNIKYRLIGIGVTRLSSTLNADPPDMLDAH